jgi:histidinol-phosphate aminotransferase
MSEPTERPAVDLSLNENQFGTLPWAELLARGLESRDFSRYHREGLLKKRLCAYHGVGADFVFPQLGAEGALLELAGSFFLRSRAGRGILVGDLSWHYYRDLARRFGLRTRTFRMLDRGEAYAFPCEEIERIAAETRPAVVLIDSPGNPAGCTLDDGQIRRIHGALDGDQILVIDETYAGFAGREDNRGDLVGELENLLVIRSFSKYYGLAAMRIGYMLAGQGARRKLELGDTLLGVDFLAERVACLALDHGERFREAARRMAEQREALADFLRGFGCFAPRRAAANFVPVRIRGGCPFSARSFAEFAADRGVRVRVLPGPPRGAGWGEGLIRITVGTAEQMTRLKAVTGLYIAGTECASGAALELCRETAELAWPKEPPADRRAAAPGCVALSRRTA